MSVAVTACGDNILGLVSSTIALCPEVLSSGFVSEGLLVRYAKAFAESLNVSSPHWLPTIVAKATLLLHSCISFLD